MTYRRSNTCFGAVLAAAAFSGGVAVAEITSIPQRALPPPQTTSGVPHVQLGVETVPAVDAELLRRVSALPGVDIRPTVVSLPGAKGFWLSEDLALEHPEVIAGGREFAHVHPDGSLHASLPPERALEAVEAGWAVRHPWAEKRPGWEGFVMLYTPQSMEELAVTFQLIVDGYNFVTGKNLRAEDY
ncbi:MAG: phospholipase [Rhodobacteraceae bacterium]|nr:phospholipase [Paracoccaceae bacterium]